MRRLAKSLLIIVLAVVAVPVSLIAYGFLTFKDDSVYSGEAYGFVVGETHEESFNRAVELKASGHIEEIQRWPEGSSPFAFSTADLPNAVGDERWSMVVDSDWWNDSIRLEFRDGQLAEIHRFRLCCELP